jgi:uncharacterized protein
VGIKIENSFVVPASIEEAWKVLVDVPRVVPCMPGIELTEMLDERRFRASARLRVGPIELLFKGEGELYDVNAAACTARLRAKGADTKGRGAFQSQMEFALTSQGPGTLVRVDSDLTLFGSVAQHARGAGVVREMAQQLAGQFAKNLGRLISTQSARSSGAAEALPSAQQPQRPAAVSGLALLFAAIRATFRRWFGRRS